MAACSTKNARVEVGTPFSTLEATKWTVEARADEIDVTNFESGGYTDYLTSYIDANGTVDAFWDKSTNVPFADPPLVLPGNQLAVRLHLHKNTVDAYYDFPVAIILSSSVDAAVRDVIRYNFTFRNKGYFVYPGATLFNGIDE